MRVGTLLRFARSDIRADVAAAGAMAILITFGGALAMGLVAGARRTDSAFDRLSDVSSPVDVVVPGDTAFGFAGNTPIEDVAQLDEVAELARVTIFPLSGRTEHGRHVASPDATLLADAEGRVGTTIERWRLVEGRRADPDRLDEAVASFAFADEYDVEVGSRVDVALFRADTFAGHVVTALTQGAPRLTDGPAGGTRFEDFADGPSMSLTVVGIEASPLGFPPQSRGIDALPLYATPAFAARFQDEALVSTAGYARLQPGVDQRSFQRALQAIAGDNSSRVVLSTRDDHAAKVRRSIRVMANGLRLLAALLAALAVVLVAQALGRQARALTPQASVLSALGVSPRGLVALGVVRGSLVAVPAATLAAVAAAAASPLFPFGLAERAEPNPGLAVDVPVLLGGSTALVGAVLILAAYAAQRANVRARARHAPRRRLAIPGVGPVWAVAGIRLSIAPGGSAGGALAGVALAVTTVTAALGVTGSLDHLLARPLLFGWNWDATIGGPGLNDLSGALVPMLQQATTIEAAETGTVVTLTLDGLRVDTVAMEPVKGHVLPALVAGRAPEGPREIVVGPVTRRELGVDAGERVSAQFGDRTAEFEVVGEAVFPDLGDLGQLGAGALVTRDGLARLVDNPVRNFYLVDFNTSASRERALEHLTEGLRPVDVSPPTTPRDLTSFGRVANFPLLVAAPVAVLGLATLLHSLLVAIRREGRDLTVMRALGLRTRHLRALVGFQGLALAVAAIVVGLPLGILVGRWLWRAWLDLVGLHAAFAVPPFQIVAVVAGALVSTVVVAAYPAWRAPGRATTDALRVTDGAV